MIEGNEMRRMLLFALALWGLAASGWAADAQYVIHISADGLRGDVLAAMLKDDGAAILPGFSRFVVEGATTFNARTDYDYTVTLPNHTCMLTGRPVEQPAGQPNTTQHGYVWNSSPRSGETLHGRGNGHVPYMASVFDVVHDAGLSTALYASKKKFVLFDRSWDAEHGARDANGPDDGTDKIDRYVYASSGDPDRAAELNDSLLADLRSNPANYSFVHWVDLDAAGHEFGWGSPRWQESLRKVDGYLVQVFECIERQPPLAGRTAVLLSADHGGEGDGHGEPGRRGDYTVPVLAWGAGVARGADLYALNRSTRADPGLGRPDYNASPQPIRNGDTGNLALMLLGLPPVPGSSINVHQDLAVGSVGGTHGPSPAVK